MKRDVLMLALALVAAALLVVSAMAQGAAAPSECPVIGRGEQRTASGGVFRWELRGCHE